MPCFILYSQGQICLLLQVFQRRRWHPTPVLLPGKSHGRRSLVGCNPRGHKESDTTERLSTRARTHTHTHTHVKWSVLATRAGAGIQAPLSSPTINTIPSTQTPSSSLLPCFCNKEAQAARLPASVWHPSAHFICSPDDRHQSALDAYLIEAHRLRLTAQGWGAWPSKSSLHTLSHLCSQQPACSPLSSPCSLHKASLHSWPLAHPQDSAQGWVAGLSQGPPPPRLPAIMVPIAQYCHNALSY